MCKVQGERLASYVVGDLPAMVGGGGRGGAALLADMVALLFYNTSACYLRKPRGDS